MWYTITVEWEDGTTRKYQRKGMVEVMKMIARIKATDESCYCKNKMKSYKITQD